MSDVTKYLDSCRADVADQADRWTHEQVQAWAGEYWQIVGNKNLTKEQQVDQVGEHMLKGQLEKNTHENGQGNTVIRRHNSTERYWFDFDDDFRADGWQQFDTDQDAWYFGVWVNPKRNETLCYAEGDVTLVVCPDREHYLAEVKAACEFHGEGFEMIACNIEGFEKVLLGNDNPDAEITVQRQDRSRFLAPT